MVTRDLEKFMEKADVNHQDQQRTEEGATQQLCLPINSRGGGVIPLEHSSILRKPGDKQRPRCDNMGSLTTYTKFPNLYDTVDCHRQTVTCHAEWPRSLPKELLILSWAVLLRSYTRIADPVFLFDGKAMKVDIPQSSWAEVEVEGVGERDWSHTAFTLNKPSEGPVLALEVYYEPGSGHVTMLSASCVPESLLEQIPSQFQQIVIEGARTHNIHFASHSHPLLSISNPQRTILPGPELLHQLVHFESNGAIAIDYLSAKKKRIQLSYQDLDQLSSRLANRISSALASRYRDVSGDKIVPILLPQSPELYVAQIAILKSGAAFCPLNLDVPKERLAFIVKDVGAKLIISTGDSRERLVELGLDLDVISSVIEPDDQDHATDSDMLGSAQKWENSQTLAYVMYTSGSTGSPKGVGVSHRAVTQALLAHDEYVPKYQRFLQFAAPTFDVSIFEIFFTFFRGSTLVCCHRQDMLSDLPAVINELHVDAAELTPTVAGTLLRSWDAVPCLKLLLTIGEKLTRSVIERFARGLGQERQWLPMYGPTEASIHCTVVSNIGFPSKAGIIGRPLSSVTAFVISEEQNTDIHILPIGFIGELAIAGQLAEGYINRPEQTQAAFINLTGYGPVYRTGDRARMLPSGELECLGRVAYGQVKIRGQRVELGEIEQIVSQVGNVRFAVASIIDGSLIVFCLLDDESSKFSCQQAIAERCKAWLPLYMRPTAIILLTEDLPRLPSGKIDLKSLKSLYRRQSDCPTTNGDDFVSEAERVVAEIFRIEFGIDVTSHDDLWSKGLDSLRAIRLASKLRDSGFKIAVTDILSADTIATLSSSLQQLQVSDHPSLSPASHHVATFRNVMSDKVIAGLQPAQVAHVADIVPCSKLQVAMLSESVITKHMNFNWIKLKIAEPVSAPKFVEAFCKLAELNDILRSGFVQLPDQDAPFVRIIWKTFDANEQVQYQKLALTERYTKEEAGSLTLLRPVRLKLVASEAYTTVSIFIHHALYDGWSWDLIMADLDSLIAGNEAPRRPKFTQFVQHEREFLSSEQATAAQDYWADHLRVTSPTQLPVLTYNKCEAKTCTFRHTLRSKSSLLNATSHQLRISRHSICSVAFATLLHLYCGTSDVVFGSVFSGRTVSVQGIDKILGPCISTLPVRINFDQLRTVGDLLAQTHRLHQNFLHFGQLPLRDIKKAAGVNGDQALFDTLFVWQEGVESERRHQSVLSVTDAMDSLPCSLLFEVEHRADELCLKATYNSSIICAGQIEIFVSQFEAIVSFYAQSPASNWQDVLNYIQPQDLSITNSDFSRVDPSVNILSTVDQIARCDPMRTAIEFVEDFDPVDHTIKASKISYGQLCEKAALVARYLLSRNVAASELIGLYMEKSTELYISLLGVLKAGAAFVVVDPQAPSERNRRIIDGSNCRYCLTRSHFADSEVLGSIDGVLPFEETQHNAYADVSLPSVAGSGLAYAVFTSGNTGIPKGVLITRSNIFSNIDALSCMYPYLADGALLQASSLNFDVSVFEILYTWYMGMRLCAASNDVFFRGLEQFIRLLNITHLSLTPAVAGLIKPTNVPKVRMLVAAGEAVTSKVFNEWSGTRLYNGYGPSETTNVSSVHCKMSTSDHINSIGRPLPNTSIFISDQPFHPLPRGAIGEIWIGGDQVGQGYINDPDLTAKKFFDHPKYGRLYRTGDLGRMLSNGTTLYLGREDDQVKFRGQRIELGEVEHAIVQFSIVADSVVLVVEDAERSSSRLVAYWSSRGQLGAKPADCIGSMFDHLQSQLPAYMVPDYLIYVEKVPLTSQGKTDRPALKQLFLTAKPGSLNSYARQEDSSTGRELKNPDEIKVAQALADVTDSRLSTISRDTSFFALGLDSINCIGLSRKLRQSGIGQVDVSVILGHASIAKLLKALSAEAGGEPKGQRKYSKLQNIFEEKWQESVKSRYAEKGFHALKILPCTPLQEAMLFQGDDSSNGAYQNRLTFSVSGDMQQIKAAWSACVAAHEILRTGFVLSPSPQFSYAQVVLADFDLSWDTEKPSFEVEEQFMIPPYSFHVVKRSEAMQTMLVLEIHHALYDGQAVSSLIYDVERIYKGSSIESAFGLEPYLEYMVGLNTEKTNEFWQAHLADYRPKLLDHNTKQPKAALSSEQSLCHIYSKISPAALMDSSKRYSVTVLSLLQLTWARLLAHCSNDPDVCFGNVYSGRNLPVKDVDRIIGPCFNTLPVRMNLGRIETNLQLARKLQAQNSTSLPFQPSSLRQIQRSQGVAKLFDTLLLLQSAPPQLDPSIWTLEEDSGDMKFPLIIEIIPDMKSSRLEMLLHTEQGVLPEGGAEAVLEGFDTLLEHTIRYPDAIATDCSMLGSERPLLLTQPTAASDTTTEVSLFQDPSQLEWSPLESFTCGVLRKVSNRDLGDFRRNTTIFQLGLDSISAIQIATELRKEGYTVTSGDILEAGTIPQIALLCENLLPNSPDNENWFDFDSFSKKHAPAVCRQLSNDFGKVEDIRPCTPFQCGILTDFIQSEGLYYFNSLRYELDNDIDHGCLRRAWEIVSSRHDILRTGFVEIDDVQCPFAMVVYSPGTNSLPWSSYEDASAQNRADNKISVLGSLHEPPWHLSIQKDGSRQTMQLSILHALYDARSLEVILDEVAMTYGGEQLSKIAPVRPCLSRILCKSSDKSTQTISISSDRETIPCTKFPDLHSHHVEDANFHVIEYECISSLGQLQENCRKAGVTLQVAGQCSWARLLSAYTGDSVNTFGVVVTGRSSENEEDNLAFPCINTVPVSIEIASVTNQKLLENVARRNAQIMKNPLAPVKGLSATQGELFDSLFVFQNPGPVRATSPWKLLDEDATASYTVSIELLPSSYGKLYFRLNFQKQIIPIDQAKLLLKQFDALLLDTLDHLDHEAVNFSHLGKDLVSIAPAKDPFIDTDIQHLHQYVEINAQNVPHKVAFEFATDIMDEKAIKMSWTYAELDADANRVAHIFQRHGAMPGDFIGFCFHKSPEASLTMLGILKAGCVYVALDPNAPEARKKFILKDSKCQILCTTQDMAASLEFMDQIEILSIDKLLKANDLPCNAVALSRNLVPEDVCYCLYTSGTTGEPKGCLITHSNAIQFVLAFQRLFANHWDADSRFLQFASFHFDVSVMEQYFSWSIGICVTSAPRDLLFQDLAAAIRALQITHIDLTPSLARLLTPEECPSLSRGAFITGGEQLRQDIIDAWGEERVIYNGYGPSEVTIGCTMYPRIPKSAKPSNIGPAYDNAGAYVLDLHSKYPVLKGAIGELCLSGPLVGKGYLNRAELTAEKFELLHHLQERIYHTGDLVRLLHDSTFCFIGRADDQVKLRGQRLEIGEINHIIRHASSAIKDVSTMVLKRQREGREQLVTFIALSEGRVNTDRTAIEPNADLALIHRVRKACHHALPNYMVPTYIIPITLMPLSANNKIDSKSLKALFEAASPYELQKLSDAEASNKDVQPEIMENITRILSKVVELPEDIIHPSSRLFELGLDSISAISLSRQLKNAGFDGANPSVIMRNPMIGDLAIAVTEPVQDRDQASRRAAKQEIAAFGTNHRLAIEAALGVSGANVEKIAPCTPLQEGMIARSLNSHDSVYLSSFTFALNDGLDVARLEIAWRQVEKENEILRTRFVPTSDGYAQVVLKNSEHHSVKLHQISKDRENGFQNAFKYDFVRWSKRVKDLENELWTVTLCRTATKTLMMLHIFHGLYDGSSLALLLEEVARYYTGKSSRWLKTSYHDVLPLGPLLSPAGAREFWSKHLTKISLLNLSQQHDSNDPIIASSSIRPSPNVKSLQLELGVTEAAIFQACWLMALKQKFDVLPTIGLVVSGRSLDVDGIEHVVGPLFNTIPFQIQTQATSTRIELVKSCHSFNVESIPYQHTPLSKISKWFGRKSNEPLFNSLFVFQRDIKETTESRKLWTEIDSKVQPDYPLVLEVQRRSDGSWMCTVVAQGAYLCDEEVQTLLWALKENFKDLAEVPHEPVALQNDDRLRTATFPEAQNGTADMHQLKQAVNGIVANNRPFQWDATTSLMRSELARLSGLEIGDVTPDTSIFELGLDSIDAIKLSARFKAAKIFLPVSRILQGGTIAGMAKSVANVETHQDEGTTSSFEGLKQELRVSLKDQDVPVDEYEKVLPVTPLQESMLANYEQYYTQDVLKISESTNVEKLKSAWHDVVAANDILRTSFVEVTNPQLASAYAQLVSQDVNLECTEITLDTEDDLQTFLTSQRADIAHKGVTQAALHLTFVRMGPDTFLIVGMPHAIYDGWSISLLHEDIATSYKEFRPYRPSYEPVLRQMYGAVSERSRSFWKSTLSDSRLKLFPSSSADQLANLKTNRFEMTSRIPVKQVIAFCRAQGVTIQSLGLTCWGFMLAKYLRSRDVCFGLVLAGRDMEDADKMMFPTMNTIPFRIFLQGSKLEMVKAVHQLSIDISEHQHFPLRQIRSLVGGSFGQLFDTLFIYQKRPTKGERLKTLYESVGGLSDPEYPVNIEMEVPDDELVWRAACRNNVLDEKCTEALLRELDDVLTSVVMQASRPAFTASSSGVSICGLTPFPHWIKDELTNAFHATELKDEHNDSSDLLSREETIREVLAEVANVEREDITKSTSLFQLGLDSISAIKVASMLKKRSMSLPVSEIMRTLTIEKMAKAMILLAPSNDQKMAKHDARALRLLDSSQITKMLQRSNISEDLVESILPCTPGQRFFLGMWQASRGRLFYPEFYYQVQGPSISRQVIDSAWRRLLQTVPILRTTFLASSTSQEPGFQAVLKDTVNPVVWTDETDGNSRNINDITPGGTRSPVMLFAAETNSTTVIKLRIHHALYDGVSLPGMMNAFKSFCINPSPPSSLQTDFQGYLRFLQNLTVKEQQKAFWKAYLHGSNSALTVSSFSFMAQRVQLFTPRLVVDLSSIEKNIKQNDISFQALFFATYALVHCGSILHPSSTTPSNNNIVAERELLTGVYLANRSHNYDGLPSLLAPTLNVVPLRIPVREESTLIETARRVQTDLAKISSIENCNVSLEEIFNWTGVKINCFINFLRLPDVDVPDTAEGRDDGGVQIEKLESNDKLAKKMQRRGLKVEAPGPFGFANDEHKIHDKNGIYMPSIDVEAALRNGALDVGLFAPRDLLDGRAAERVMEEMKRVLLSIC